MKHHIILTLTLALAISFQLFAQNKITGAIFDSDTKLPVSFATISLSETNQGTISNEDGRFDLISDTKISSITISFLGYEELVYVLDNKKEDIELFLKPWAYDLPEVTVKPQSPLEYIRQAIANHPDNVSTEPFLTQAYFSASNIIEQDSESNITKNEAVFQTYYANYSDTSVAPVNRLILHRHSDNEVEVELSRVLNQKKVERKISKLKKKNNEKDEQIDQPQTDQNESILAKDSPRFALSVFRQLTNVPFLQEENFDDILFTHGQPSYYNNNELLVINFNSEKRIDFSHYSGRIYLNKNNLAFVSLAYKEFTKIPKLLRPIIKSMIGINIQSVENDVQLYFQPNNALWYPQKLVFKHKVNIKKGKTFKNNEHLSIAKKHIYHVEKLQLSEVNPITVENEYNHRQPFENQVKPLPGIEWKNINVVND